MIGFAAQRLMELDVESRTGAAHGERSPDRLARRNGYRDRDWQTRAGTVELRSLKLRAAWSNAFLSGQLEALGEAARSLESLAADLPGAPLPATPLLGPLPDSRELEAIRDEGEAKLSALIDWLAKHPGQASEAVAQARAIVDQYINRQTKYELAASARPMFVEMSGGAEKG